MRRVCLFVALALTLSLGPVYAAEPFTPLLPVSKDSANGKLWGYINVTDKLVVPYEFSNAEPFTRFVTDTGETVWLATAARADSSTSVLASDGHELLRTDNSSYVRLDKTGIFVQSYGSEGTHTQVYDLSGQSLFTTEGSLPEQFWNGFTRRFDRGVSRAVCDRNGKTVSPPPSSYLEIICWNAAGTRFVILRDDSTWALVDAAGAVIRDFPQSYNGFVAFMGNETFRMADTSSDLSGTYRFSDGAPVLPHKYVFITPFSDGRAVASERSGAGLIDEQGTYLAKPNYAHLFHIGDGFYSGDTYDGKRVLLDRDGKVLLSRKDGVTLFPYFQFGHSYYVENGKTIVFGTDGKIQGSVDTLHPLVFVSETILLLDGRYVEFPSGKVIWDGTTSVSGGLTVSWKTLGQDGFRDGRVLPYTYKQPEVTGYADAALQARVNKALNKVFNENGAPAAQQKMYHDFIAEAAAQGWDPKSIWQDKPYIFPGSENFAVIGGVGSFSANYGVGWVDIEAPPRRSAVTLNLMTGKTYTLGDLLVPDFADKLAALLDPDTQPKHTLPPLGPESSFELTEDALVLVGYENTARYGAYTYLPIPFEKLDGLINKAGELWYSLSQGSADKAASAQVTFSDLPPEHWSFPYVTDANALAIIKGDIRNGKAVFRPSENLTYAEAAALVARIMKLPDTSRRYEAINQAAWYAKEVNAAYAAGLLDDLESRFDPNRPIPREDAALLLANGLHLRDKEPALTASVQADILRRFTDAQDRSDVSGHALAVCVQAGFFEGSGGQLHPRNPITRAETAKVMTLFRLEVQR